MQKINIFVRLIKQRIFQQTNSFKIKITGVYFALTNREYRITQIMHLNHNC